MRKDWFCRTPGSKKQVKVLPGAACRGIDHRVPVKGRTLFVSTDMFNALMETDHFKTLDKLGGKAVANGQIGEIFGSPVVAVPSNQMPAGVNFIWMPKTAEPAPAKLPKPKCT